MELKQYIGEKIKYYRKLNKMTQEELASKLNTTKQAVSRYEKGTRKANQDILFQLCDIFNISIDDFFPSSEANNSELDELIATYNTLHHPRQQKVYNFAKEQLDEQEAESNVVQFPDKIEEETEEYELNFLGGISAGTGEWLEDEQLETLTFANVPVGADFCLQVNGDSMEPLFHDDEYVFIRKDTNIRSGTIGAIIVNGEAFLKKIYIENNNLRLVSLNKKYDDVIVTEHDSYKYVGTVVV